MALYYYLTIFPTEAFIASMLPPKRFGSYMATGSRKGSSEKIMFIEIEGEFGNYFDWTYGKKRCVPHANGDLKNSVYLSVYRALEHTDMQRMKNLFLTTPDGRTLELESGVYSPMEGERQFFIYKELCPVNPLIVTTLNPHDFGVYMTDPKSKVSVPCIVFADLKMVDFDNPHKSGNIGSIYDKKSDHLKECIHIVTTYNDKYTKTLDRSHIESFSYQAIRYGIFIAKGEEVKFYGMKLPGELKLDNDSYDWGKSAMIL